MSHGRRRRKTDRHGPTAAGILVTERRHALGLTQSDLADLAGVGISSVRTLESGRTSVTLDIATRILDALGLVAAFGPGSALRGVDGAAVVDRPEAP